MRPGSAVWTLPYSRRNRPAIKEPDGEPRAGAGTWPAAGADAGPASQPALPDRFQPPPCDSARPSSPSRPSPARTESALSPATAVSFSTELVVRSGRASSRMRSSRVSPSWTAARPVLASGSDSPLGEASSAISAGVGDADRPAFPEQPVAARGVGAVHRPRHRADGPAQGFRVVRRVQRAGSPPRFHDDRDRRQRGDQPVALQEPVPRRRGARRDFGQDRALVGDGPQQLLVAGGVEAVHSPCHHGDGGHAAGGAAGEGSPVGVRIDPVGAARDDREAPLCQRIREVARHGGAIGGAVPGTNQRNGRGGRRQLLLDAAPPQADRFLQSEVRQLPGPQFVRRDDQATAEPLHRGEVPCRCQIRDPRRPALPGCRQARPAAARAVLVQEPEDLLLQFRSGGQLAGGDLQRVLRPGDAHECEARGVLRLEQPGQRRPGCPFALCHGVVLSQAGGWVMAPRSCGGVGGTFC